MTLPLSRRSQEAGKLLPAVRLSRRDVREHIGWGNTQLKIHLKRLEELEYLIVHRGGRGQSFVYELLYEARAEEGQRFLARLIDVDQLRRERAGSNGSKSGGGRPLVVVMSPTSRLDEKDATPDPETINSSPSEKAERNGHLDTEM